MGDGESVRITLTGGRSGEYVLVEELADGSLLIVPAPRPPMEGSPPVSVSRSQAAIARLRAEISEGAARPTQPVLAEVEECRVLGSHGVRLGVDEPCRLVVTSEGVRIDPAHSAQVFISYERITAFEISGGVRRSGGGFVGGGFGLQGAADGMLIAAALNSLTTRTHINTVLCVQSTNAEIFFHVATVTPDALRIRLSPAFSALRNRPQKPAAASEAEGPDLVGRLQTLADMRTRELLTAEEFEELKAQVLGKHARSADR